MGVPSLEGDAILTSTPPLPGWQRTAPPRMAEDGQQAAGMHSTGMLFVDTCIGFELQKTVFLGGGGGLLVSSGQRCESGF